jgi:hypothetical protein
MGSRDEAAMALKTLLVIVGLAAAAIIAAPPCAQAQPTGPVTQPIEPLYPPPPAPPAPAATSARQRIEIHPRPLLYRRCVDWYELQHRPSGTVLFPQMRCWWVRG